VRVGWHTRVQKTVARSEPVGGGGSDRGGGVMALTTRSDSAHGVCGEGNCLGGLGRLVASWAGLTRG
jgi:hypothetical protein